MSGALLNAALWYADLGYPVFPCAPGRKTPITDHGLLDATTEPEQISEWWSSYPQANVAIRTNGLLVVDVDGAENPWLLDEPDKLQRLAIAPTSLTPRGGRQYIFRQPAGRAWRNTAGQLAAHVDTRANGGYVVVAPSIVAGTAYRWLGGLDLPAAEKLDPPPDWLVALLDRIAARDGVTSATPVSETAIPTGQRNATLARLAGAMRRVGMSQAEILAALLRVNIDRCHPPMPQREVERIAASIARYAPDSIAVALIEDHYGQDRRQPAAGPLSSREIMKLHSLRKPVIRGLLRRGETMNVIAAPKTGKSWLVLGQAMAIATGRPWLGLFPAERGRVLILDNELHPETIAHRIPQVAAALGIGMDEIAEQIYVHPLRGQLRDILAMAAYFDAIEPRHYSAIILDAMYRFMPAGTDENDNGAMAGIYNRLDAYAERLGCCFIAIHHTTKGNQSAKSVTDVGAGAGSQSRAADAHLVLRPHEEPGAVVLEAVVRSWAPVTPIALRWEFPVWRPAPELDPAALRSEKLRRRSDPPEGEAETPADWDAEGFVQTLITERPQTRMAVLDAASALGLSRRRAQELLYTAEGRGLVHRWGGTGRKPAAFALIPEPLEDRS
ncbi:MAG: bifunctional DNA primase/polymerase [Phycisphaerae bacterium]|nr:bifunctional DNA primase/polymerase [Phycisphaerae bacterium]